MLPRSWLSILPLITLLLAACQPIRLLEDPTAQATPAAIETRPVPSTTTSEDVDCFPYHDPELDVIISVNWSVGSKYKYQATSSLTRVKNGEEQSPITTTYTIEITVLDMTEEGFLMAWEGITTIPTTHNVRLEYSISPLGEFIELRNAEQYKSLTESVKLQLASIPQTPIKLQDSNDIPTLTQQAISIIANDIQAFHTAYGLYFTDKPINIWQNLALLPANHVIGQNQSIAHLSRHTPQVGCLDLFISTKWQANPGTMTKPYVVDTASIIRMDTESRWAKVFYTTRTMILDGEGYIYTVSLEQLPSERVN